MKHLKLFEDHTKLWEPITYQQSIEYLGKDTSSPNQRDNYLRTVDISKSEFNIVKDISHQDWEIKAGPGRIRLSSNMWRIPLFRPEAGNRIISYGAHILYIYKNDDDFFVVRHHTAINGRDAYFLCDDIEGLVDFIKGFRNMIV